ncbi:hypothetical protein RV03_GL003166 [Enterococcus gallinarum]|nr:hypothetical protein RV03_GL003166 [Enterococcus gallinarum]
MNLYDLQLSFSNYGIKTKVGKIDINQLEKIPKPCVLSISQNKNLINHYVVLFSIKKNIATIGDPSTGEYTIPLEKISCQKKMTVILCEPTKKIDEIDESLSFLFFFKKYIKENKKTLFTISLISMFLTFITILGTFVYAYLIDTVLPKKSISLMITGATLFFLVYTIKFVVDIVRQRIIINYSKYIENDIMDHLYKKMLYLPQSFFDKRSIGDITSRINDVFNLRSILSSTLVNFFMDIIMLLTGLLTLVYINKILFFVVFIQVVASGFSMILFKKIMYSLDKMNREKNSRLEAITTETILGMEKIKTNLKEKYQLSKLLNVYHDFSDNTAKYGKIISLSLNINEYIGNVFKLLILVIGVLFIISNKISLGELITFSSLSTFFISPMNNIINTLPQLQNAKIIYDRLLDIIDNKTEYKNSGKYCLSNFESLVVKDVSYKYGNKPILLNNLNFSVKKGEKIGIVGQTGEGKTTLVKLLYRLLPLQEGNIFINQKDIKDYSLKSIREKIGYVSQKPFLFRGTIRENLIGSSDDYYLEKKMKSLAKKIGIHDHIMALPLGYDTIVFEGGKSLSGGQIQKICFLQQILRDIELLILDEATASMDAFSEDQVTNIISSLNITTIIISHKLTSVIKCNKIFLLRDGFFSETGNHKELLEKDGIYAKLWKTQMSIGGISNE